MQTRDELYAVLDYHTYERKLDELNAKDSRLKASQPKHKPGRKRGRKP